MRTRAVSLRFNGVVTLASLLGQPTHPSIAIALCQRVYRCCVLTPAGPLSVCLALPMFETDLVICAFHITTGAISQRWAKRDVMRGIYLTLISMRQGVIRLHVLGPSVPNGNPRSCCVAVEMNKA